MVDIEQFICRDDNFGVLLHDPASGRTAAIDAPDAGAILDALARRGWTLTDLLITHHHGDHVAGLAALKAVSGCTVVGPAAEAARIAGLDVHVRGGNRFLFGNHAVDVIDTPGHTAGQIAYHLPGPGRLFAADCLFSLGCGRLLEGTAAEMWESLRRLSALPGATLLHCGHEYTLANARFALSVDPGNAALAARAEEARALRSADLMTLPVTLAREKETNPFLRPHDAAIRAGLGMEAASDAEVFAELRRRKDRFA